MTETGFTAEGLKMSLVPRAVRYFEQVGSTNDVGLGWLSEGAPDGSVVVANEQTKGRGRLGRLWYAPAGTALMFSYLLRPDVAVLPRVGMMGALAVCETLEHLGVEGTGIKWPNDVQIAGHKVCGVLPEAQWQVDQLAGVVLGIGVNVRVDFTGSPFETTAISLETVLGRPIDRVELLTQLLARLDSWREQLGNDALFAAWRGRLNMLHTLVTVGSGANVIHGMAVDVDAEGALLVRGADGTLQRAIAGDIALG